jgi:hypothetical protein
VSVGAHKPRDLSLLDAVDALPREPFEQSLWRVTREGRDPLQGAPSVSRWCNAGFDVLYTSFERDGALAEIYALLSAQPVFPSKIRFVVHRVAIRAAGVLRLADFPAIAKLGVDTSRYGERIDHRTQEIADAAYFLGFDGLIAPSARWKCSVLAAFTQRISPGEIRLELSEANPIDWAHWRRTHVGRGRT